FAVIVRGVDAAALVPALKVLKLHTERGGLQRVEARVQPDVLVEVLRLHAVHAQNTHQMSQLLIVRRYDAAIPEAAKVLAGEEAVGDDIAAGLADTASLVFRANALRGIFYHLQANCSAVSMISSISQSWPKRCTGMTALVLSVTRRSISLAGML